MYNRGYILLNECNLNKLYIRYIPNINLDILLKDAAMLIHRLNSRLKKFVTLNFSKRTYAFTMTLLANFRVIYKYSDKQYLVKDGDQTHFFLKQRGSRYLNGLRNCGEKLAKSYGIEEILISDSDLVVDVGANNGDLLLYLRKFSKFSYIGFEPSLLDFKLLERNYETSSVYNLAVLDKKSKVNFYLSSQEADSSIHQPVNFEFQSLVNGIRLDDFLKVNSKIRILKVDAEGAELEVIMGAKKILSQIEYIAIDLGFEKGVNQETTAPEVINYLLENNFNVVNFTKRNCFLFKNTTLSG